MGGRRSRALGPLLALLLLAPASPVAACRWLHEPPRDLPWRAPFSTVAPSREARIGMEAALFAETRSPDGSYVQHCARAPEGCEQRVMNLAVRILTASRVAESDPLLLAALAQVATGLDPEAREPDGRVGAWLLRQRSGSRRNKRLPTASRQAGDAARTLQSSLLACRDVAGAVTHMQVGECAPSEHSRRTREVYDRMKSRARAAVQVARYRASINHQPFARGHLDVQSRRFAAWVAAVAAEEIVFVSPKLATANSRFLRPRWPFEYTGSFPLLSPRERAALGEMRRSRDDSRRPRRR